MTRRMYQVKSATVPLPESVERLRVMGYRTLRPEFSCETTEEHTASNPRFMGWIEMVVVAENIKGEKRKDNLTIWTSSKIISETQEYYPIISREMMKNTDFLNNLASRYKLL